MQTVIVFLWKQNNEEEGNEWTTIRQNYPSYFELYRNVNSAEMNEWINVGTSVPSSIQQTHTLSHTNSHSSQTISIVSCIGIPGEMSLQWADCAPRSGPLGFLWGNLLLFNPVTQGLHKRIARCPLQSVKEILLVSTIFRHILNALWFVPSQSHRSFRLPVFISRWPL